MGKLFDLLTEVVITQPTTVDLNSDLFRGITVRDLLNIAINGVDSESHLKTKSPLAKGKKGWEEQKTVLGKISDKKAKLTNDEMEALLVNARKEKLISAGGSPTVIAKNLFGVQSSNSNYSNKNTGSITTTQLKPMTDEDSVEDSVEDSGASRQAKTNIEGSLDSKVTKEFAKPSPGSRDRYGKVVRALLDNMLSQVNGNVRTSIILTGDPGTGKTSFIKTFSQLLGIPLVVVEAPHIIEEHLITIPYLVVTENGVKKDAATIEISDEDFKKETKGMTADQIEDYKVQNSLKKLEDKNYSIVSAESHLVSKLNQLAKEHITHKSSEGFNHKRAVTISSDPVLFSMKRNYGPLIEKASDSYNVILFLDEYFRNTQVKIRNILRGILNGEIGGTRIPKGIYIVYASNMKDSGLTKPPKNTDLQEVELETPNKEEWFAYILNKYEKSPKKMFKHIELNDKVFNAFYHTLDENDLNNNSPASDVRTSPRRMEQLLLYVNSNIPVVDEADARALMSNVAYNFTHYKTGKVSEVYTKKIKPMMVSLIKETNPSLSKFDGAMESPYEWKGVLFQQLKTKMKMDSLHEDIVGLDGKIQTKVEARKYLPVITGEPGVGKTTHSIEIADKLGLKFISVDVSNMNSEEVTGIPKGTPITDPETGRKKFSTDFTKPPLLARIENLMKEADKKNNDKKPIERLQKPAGRYEYLLLIDEISRAKPDVFNVIRRLLLEKEFNEEWALPESILVIGALNPEDGNSVQDLTSHTQDVLDFIPTKASWSRVKSYLVGLDSPKNLKKLLGDDFDCPAKTVEAIEKVLERGMVSEDNIGPMFNDNERLKMLDYKEEGIFYQNAGTEKYPQPFYLSPREICTIVEEINTGIFNSLLENGVDDPENSVMIDADDLSPEERLEYEKNAGKGDTNGRVRFNLSQTKNYSDSLKKEFIYQMLVAFISAFQRTASFTTSAKHDFNKDAYFTLLNSLNYMEDDDENPIFDIYKRIFRHGDGLVVPLNDVYENFKSKRENIDSFKSSSASFSTYFSTHSSAFGDENGGVVSKELHELFNDTYLKSMGDISDDQSEMVDIENFDGETVSVPQASLNLGKLYLLYLQFIGLMLDELVELQSDNEGGLHSYKPMVEMIQDHLNKMANTLAISTMLSEFMLLGNIPKSDEEDYIKFSTIIHDALENSFGLSRAG